MHDRIRQLLKCSVCKNAGPQQQAKQPHPLNLCFGAKRPRDVLPVNVIAVGVAYAQVCLAVWNSTSLPLVPKTADILFLATKPENSPATFDYLNQTQKTLEEDIASRNQLVTRSLYSKSHTPFRSS